MPERCTEELTAQLALERQLLAAHASSDTAQLAVLYDQAAQAMAGSGNLDAAAYYMTHAYVYALESGIVQAADFAAWLRQHGRL